MDRRRFIVLTCALVATSLFASPVGAEPPWKKLVLFKKIDADPDKEYRITEQQGPWMIMCATFSGDDAMDQAHELVIELRKKFKLNAYLHDVEFDFTQEGLTGRIDPRGNPIPAHYRQDRLREYAVLVGDYPSVDDAQAQRVLKKLKYALPECMDLRVRVKEGKKDHRSLGALRTMQSAIYELVNDERKEKGPMGHAFVTTNPLLPDEYFVPRGVDEVVEKINQEVKYSLLDCPGMFTVKVASFTGHAEITPDGIRDVESGRKKMTSRLAQAAEDANTLTLALRSMGVEAYEFHDRYCSIVAVGSFDWVQRVASDGHVEVNEDVTKIIGEYGIQGRLSAANKEFKPGEPKSMKGIPFDPMPVPIEVPRRASNSRYNRSTVTQR